MELEQISQDHPLNFKEVQIDEGKDVVCYGCRKPILDTEYICGENHYSLHKRCAELPQKTRDPIHPQHLLTLHRDSPFKSSTYICDVCKESRDRFNYFCRPCDFNICILCFLEDRMITLAIHEHPLAVLFRPASFHCNVCGEEDKDSSYLCYPCQFWIHKTCASLPNTIKISDHHDSLTLVKKYFHNVTNFRQDCNICGAHIRSDSWTYCCGSCKYFVHVKCATSDRKKKLAAPESEPLRGGEDNADEYLNSNTIRLPVNNDSVDLIRYFTGTINLEESMRESQMDHSSHEHPLSFFDAENYSKLKDDKLLCSGCVRPVELPFYSCLRCNYFLHFGCARAPDKLEHPSHQKYSLELSQGTDFYSLSECNACNLDSNGFFYECRTKTCGCELNLDIKCALLPRTIKHESHEHPLDQSGGLDHRCKACNDDISRFGFGCDRCKFYLHYDCALFPHTVKHRWDRHLLILNYGPLSNHPDEYHCEYCEDEINPKYWFYHCSGDCDQSFHTECIGNVNPNVMYGGTIKVDDHPHTLKFVEQEEKKSTCCSCGEPIEDVGFLECLECTYTICLECVD